MNKINWLKSMMALLIFCCAGSALHAQQHQLYVGPGTGLDYGGIGGKVEYLPVKNFGVFTGLGFNLLTIGWNVGATYKIPVSRMVSVNPMAMFGYNSVNFSFGDFPEYDKVSYGPSFGANVDIKLGKRGNKLSAGLFIPIRSKEFNDLNKVIEKDNRITFRWEMPVTISVGYNFKMLR